MTSRHCFVWVLLLTLTACTRGPLISSFTVSDDTVTAGTSVTLNWSARNYDRLTLTPGVGDVAGQSQKTVSPSTTTTYTLIAERGGSRETESLTVEVGTAPSIEAFSVSPNPVAQGQTATLSWQVTNATTVTIDGQAQATTGMLSVGVAEGLSRDFTLVASNAFGTDQDVLTLRVDDGGPSILAFGASPDELDAPGQDVTLSWNVSGKEGPLSLTIDQGVGDVSGRTSVTVRPTESTLYTLSAADDSGARTAEVAVTVGDAPSILKFEADDTTVPPGSPVALSWSVVGADPLTLELNGAAVSGSGTTVTPNADTTYTLVATNSAGSVTAELAIDVGSAPVINSFTVDETVVATGSAVSFSWAVSGADTLALEPFGSVSGSSQTVQVNTTTEYRLSATNAYGTTRSSPLTVTAGDPPSITAFNADPDSFSEDDPQSVTLSWTVEGSGAVAVTVDNGGGSFSGSGQTTVEPSETTTYTLSASSQFGTDEASVTVTVTPPLPEGNIVLLIAGQSNATGEGSLDGDGESGVPVSGIPQVRMLGNDYRWKQAEEPVDSNFEQLDTISLDSSPGHSFGVSLGRSLYTDTAKDVYLIPASKGGSCLTSNCSTAYWEPMGATSRSTLFGSANYRAMVSGGEISSPPRDASPEGGAVTALIWYQGESERTNSTNFIADTNVVMDAFMSELDQTGDSIVGVPVIYMQLAQRLADPTRNQGYQEGREGQRRMETQFGDPASRRDNYYMVVTHDLPMWENNHLSALGQKLLGERISKAYQEHVLGLPVDGTGPRLLGLSKDATTVRVRTNQTINDDDTYEHYFTVIVNNSDNRTLTNGKIASIQRDPGDAKNVLITLGSALNPGDKVVVQYMPPSPISPSFPTSQLSGVVKNPLTGLPLPAFTVAVP